MIYRSVLSPRSSCLQLDDCILYKAISNENDSKALQQDLDHLQQWEQIWLMRFHPEKCQLLRVTKKKKKRCRVRPILEYASPVWDPFRQKDIDCLEKVQRRCARFVHQDFSREKSVTHMINSLGWESLAERRAKAKVTYSTEL